MSEAGQFTSTFLCFTISSVYELLVLALFSCPTTAFCFSSSSTLITNTMTELDTYKDNIQTKLVPYTETSTAQLTQDIQLMINRLQKDMLDAKERGTEYHRELQAMVDHNTGDIHGRLNTFIHKLQKRLNKDTEEIRK